MNGCGVEGVVMMMMMIAWGMLFILQPTKTTKKALFDVVHVHVHISLSLSLAILERERERQDGLGLIFCAG